MTIAPMAELFSLTQASPVLARSELEAWDHCTEQIITAARERTVPDPANQVNQVNQVNELYLRALAGSVISCGKAAMEVWFDRCGTDLSAESMAVLRQLLIDSMSLLGSGFTATAPSEPPAPARTKPSAPHSPDRS
jgi:hypothetical protein